MMHGAGTAGGRSSGVRGGENDGASGSKRETDQTLARDFKIGQSVGRNLHDAARAGERRRDVEIALHVESQSLRPSQTLVESAHRSVGIDFVNAVGGPGDKQIALRTESQVVGGNAELEGGENKDLLVARDLEDGAVAVANVETLLA